MSLKSMSLRVYVGILIVSAGFAQTDQARIVGVVTDTYGAVIPGASIVVQSLKTGQERAVKSNGQGFYVVTNLLPANYKLTAHGEGLGPTEYTEIILGIGQERTVNITLLNAQAAIALPVRNQSGEIVAVVGAAFADEREIQGAELDRLQRAAASLTERI